MRILPKTPAQQIERLSVLLPAWAEDPAAIGLSPAKVAQIQVLLEHAQSAHAAALEARQAAQSATLAFENATRDLIGQAGPAIATIKAFAVTSAQASGILAQARLPARAPDQRNKPVPAPSNAAVTVDQRGRAIITWTTGAGGARGARLGRQSLVNSSIMYTVERRPARARTGTVLATTARPMFVDPDPLPGASTYTIRALRTKGTMDRHPPCTTVVLNLPTAPIPATPAATRRAA